MEFLEINQVQGYLCYWLENVSLAEGKTAKKNTEQFRSISVRRNLMVVTHRVCRVNSHNAWLIEKVNNNFGLTCF